MIAGKTIVAPSLYSVDIPVNLLGRDHLCPLKANIMFTQNGLYVDFPREVPMKMLPMMAARKADQSDEPRIYWMRIHPQESRLHHMWNMWEPWVLAQMKTGGRTPTLAYHCTLWYNEQQLHND